MIQRIANNRDHLTAFGLYLASWFTASVRRTKFAEYRSTRICLGRLTGLCVNAADFERNAIGHWQIVRWRFALWIGSRRVGWSRPARRLAVTP